MKFGSKSASFPRMARANEPKGVDWITPRGHGGSLRRRDPSMVARMTMRKDPTKKQVQCVLIIYDQLMKAARLMAGDRVIVGFDRDQYLLIKRVPEHGFTLSPVGTNTKARRDAIGRASTSTLKFSTDKNIKPATFGIDDVLLDSDTVQFPIELAGDAA